MKTLLQQIKTRRQTLGFKQNDMLQRVGVSRQQYQRLETKGNPRLDTLALIAMRLNSELMLIPREKLNAVLALLNTNDTTNDTPVSSEPSSEQAQKKKVISDDPWQDLLGDPS